MAFSPLDIPSFTIYWPLQTSWLKDVLLPFLAAATNLSDNSIQRGMNVKVRCPLFPHYPSGLALLFQRLAILRTGTNGCAPSEVELFPKTTALFAIIFGERSSSDRSGCRLRLHRTAL